MVQKIPSVKPRPHSQTANKHGKEPKGMAEMETPPMGPNLETSRRDLSQVKSSQLDNATGSRMNKVR